MRWSTRLAWPATIVVTGLTAVGFAGGFHPQNAHNGLLGISFTVVGAYVVRRSPGPESPGHREGSLFLAGGVASAVMFACRQAGYHPGVPGAEIIAWFGIWPLPLVMALTGVAIMAFPSGRLPSTFWRRVAVGIWVVAAALALVSALWPVEYARTELLVPHPFALPGVEVATAVYGWVSNVVFLVFQLLWAACVFDRMLRGDRSQRRQLRWFVGATVAAVLAMVLGLAVADTVTPGLLTLPIIPLAAGYAMVEASYESLLADLRGSARRIVTAGDDVRRKLERDLHDGAQQRLVALGMELGTLVETANASGDSSLAATAARARTGLLEATAELRELAQGIHPTILTEQGLLPAAQRLAERSPIPVTVSGQFTSRLAPELEAAAYFVLSEALTNAAKHSRATDVRVRLEIAGRQLVVRVADDGCGGADPAGRGLLGLADRVRALEGSLRVESDSTGTTVWAVLPCG